MKKNSKNNLINIPQKAMLGIAPAIGIIAVLFAKHKAPEVLLFLIGIFCGVIIGVNWIKGQK